MQRFIRDKNLTLFLRRLLAEQQNLDEERRQVILTLLAEEEAKSSVPGPSYPVQHAVEHRHAGARVGWKQGAWDDR
jgi:hypothetical protein